MRSRNHPRLNVRSNFTYKIQVVHRHHAIVSSLQIEDRHGALPQFCRNIHGQNLSCPDRHYCRMDHTMRSSQKSQQRRCGISGSQSLGLNEQVREPKDAFGSEYTRPFGKPANRIPNERNNKNYRSQIGPASACSHQGQRSREGFT